MWLSDVFTRVESVGKAMAAKKSKQQTSFGDSLIGFSTIKNQGQSWLPKNKKGELYQDWRGIVLSDTKRPYSMHNNEEHQARLMHKTRRHRVKEILLQTDKTGKQKHELKKGRKETARIRTYCNAINEKVKRIGPHIEIFEAFKHVHKSPPKDKVVSSAICIQKLIRGWFDRLKMERIKLKAKSHGPSLTAVVNEFRKMMFRIKRHCGILDTSTPLIFDQLEDWLDNKIVYETVFKKREYSKEMDTNELPKFFRDCGRFPSQKEITKTLNLVFQDSKTININKTQAVEMAFMLYPPVGLKLETAAVPRSTWVKPIVDGEDSYMLLKRGHPMLKLADIQVAGALVAASMRERKWKEQEGILSSVPEDEQ